MPGEKRAAASVGDGMGPRARVARPGGETSTSALPSDWQDDALRRLTLVAGSSAALAAVGFVLSFLRQPNLGVRAGAERPMWAVGAGFAASLVMFAMARRRKLAVTTLLDVGLVYFVFMCLLASVYRHALPYADSDVVRGVSPVVPAIVVMAVFVPTSPKRMALAVTSAALMDPLGLVLAIATGSISAPPWNLWLWLLSPTFLIVPVAVAASVLFARIGKTVRALRETGSYRLVERLGVGGMGEVWRAEHRSLRRRAAVKLVRPELLGATDEASRARIETRFWREAQATASLTSPHVVEVYDFGVADDGSLYYVMELLEGLDLETLVRASGPLPPERASFLLRQLLMALRDAHEAGLVHRDVKPANILVAKRGGMHDFVKLVDFGLVRPVEAEVSDEGPLTLAGSIAGTPGYLAPEAAAGGDVDGRADLYAVGCIAYRLLAGRDVFESTNVYGLIVQHATSTPEPLAQVCAQPISEALAAWVHRALEKPLPARWQSAAAMIDALDATGLPGLWTDADAAAAWSALGDPKRAAQGVAETLAGEAPPR